MSTDDASSNGAAVVASAPNHPLAQADQYSGQVGWDNLTAGGMSYTRDTQLAHKYQPSELTILGNDLFVAQGPRRRCRGLHAGSQQGVALSFSGKLTGASLSNQGGSTAVFTKP